MKTYRLEKFLTIGWDAKYASVSVGRRPAEEFTKQLLWPVLQGHLRKPGRYLDIGFGAGGWLLFLRDQGYDVAGVEVAEKTVARLKDIEPSVEVNVGSITSVPYPDKSFDGAYGLGVLEYVEGQVPQALAEVARILKPGGWFLLEVPTVNTLRKYFYIPLKKLEKILRPNPFRHFSNYLFDRHELKKMLREASFEVVAEQAHELPEATRHYGLWIDWPFLRGGEHYELNMLGRIAKKLAHLVSPWVASTGVVIVTKKI